MKPVSSAAEAAKPRNVSGVSQPHFGASMMVKTSVPMAAIERISPRQSSAGASL